MKIEDIERADLLISVIKQAQKQIEGYKELKAVNEIVLVANDHIFAEIKKDKRYNKESPAPMYYTGKVKDAMIDVLIQNKQEFLDIQLKELGTI